MSSRDFRTGATHRTPLAGRLEIGLGALVLLAALVACVLSRSQRASAEAQLARTQAEVQQSRTRLA